MCVGRDDIDLVIIGASIRYGTFNKDLVALINQHVDFLNQTRSVFYSVCLTARKPGRDNPEEDLKQLELLKNTHWRPTFKAVFAGQLDYPRYNFFDRQMIRLIMKLTGGCTDGKSTIDYTDWEKVSTFSSLLLRDSSAVSA